MISISRDYLGVVYMFKYLIFFVKEWDYFVLRVR